MGRQSTVKLASRREVRV